MCLVYPWYNLQQPKIYLVYLKALVYTRHIPGICSNTKTYQRGQDSRCIQPDNFRCKAPSPAAMEKAAETGISKTFSFRAWPWAWQQ